MCVFQSFTMPSFARLIYRELLNHMTADSDSLCATLFEGPRLVVHKEIETMNVSDEQKMLSRMVYEDMRRVYHRNKRIERERVIQMAIEKEMFTAADHSCCHDEPTDLDNSLPSLSFVAS
jgi:hypothetical protein